MNLFSCKKVSQRRRSPLLTRQRPVKFSTSIFLHLEFWSSNHLETFQASLLQPQCVPCTLYPNLLFGLEYSFLWFSSRMNFIIFFGDLVRLPNVSPVLICSSKFHLQNLNIMFAGSKNLFVLDILLFLIPFSERPPLNFSDKTAPLRW